MKKEEMLKFIDNLMDDEKEAIEMYNKGIDKMSDSPYLVGLLSDIYRDEARHVEMLNNAKRAIENHEDNMARMVQDRLFGMSPCIGCGDDGIVFDTEDKD